MNIRHIIGCLIILCAVETKAQWSVGARIGANVSTNLAMPLPLFPLFQGWMISEQSYNNKLDLLISTLVERKISEQLDIQFGIEYTRRHLIATANIPANLINTVSRFSLEYLSLPFMLKIKFFQSEFEPFLLCGTLLQYHLTGVFSSETTDQKNYTYKQSINIRNDIVSPESASTKALDLSIACGLGVKYHINPDLSLFADFRYIIGLTNTNNLDTVDPAFTRNIRFGLGVMMVIE